MAKRVGETKMSWLVGPSGGRKVLKKTMLENHGANWGSQRLVYRGGGSQQRFLR